MMNKNCDQINSVNLHPLCGDTCSTVQPKKMRSIPSKVERILISCLECLIPFLSLQEVNALGLANQTWSKKIPAKDTKKQPYYMDRKSSLLVYCYAQNLLHNSKTHPMTSARLLRLSKLGRARGVTILPFACTRYLDLSYKDYERNILLQRLVREIPCTPELQTWHPYAHLAAQEFSNLFSEMPYYKQAIDEQVAGHGLTQLKKFTALHSLSLQGPFKDDELGALECLAGTLERLSVTSAFVSNIGLKTLTQLHALKELTLQTPNITDIGLGALSSLTQLQSLSFVAYPRITTSHFNQLTHLVALQHLSFVDCHLNNIEGLGDFTRLRSLTIRNCNGMADHHLNPLNKLTLLQHLNLSANAITDSGLAQLSGLTALQELMIEFTKVDENRLYELWGSHFPALKAVSCKRPCYPPPLKQPPDTIYYAGEGLYIRNKPELVDEEAIKRWREHFASIEKDLLRTFFM